MQWTRSDTLALSRTLCAECGGTGMIHRQRTGDAPCKCVLRNIFRICYRKFRECAIKDRNLAQPMLERVPGRVSRCSWGRKNEEYAADFVLVSRRLLTEREYRMFRYHYLLGADWRLCCAKLGMERGEFFREIYRIEAKLGRGYCEIRPYALFPIRDYFGRTTNERVYSSLRLRREREEGKPHSNPQRASEASSLPKAA